MRVSFQRRLRQLGTLAFTMATMVMAAPDSNTAAHENARKLIADAKCEACHKNKVGGDGSAIYSRKDRRVTTKNKLLPQVARNIIRLDLARGVAKFSQRIELPLAPFMGIMAVAPPSAQAPANSKPPGAFGGNMDLKVLTRGATLYLPVFNEGAQFFTGDGHGLQGDGEVNGTALEISLTPTLQFILHPGAGRNMKWPRAEDRDCHYVMGMDTDLNEAAHLAILESVAFLQEHAGLSAADAYALTSLGVDFRIGEAVNHVKMVYGAIPKRLLLQRT